MIATGGKTVYGAEIGILMLEAQFPRIPGDMGNALTWPFPVHYKVVTGASPDLVVRKGAPGLLEDFIAAGRDLITMGARAITTNCGFLSLMQDPLKEALGVPVAASSLMQLPLVNSMLPAGQRAGILTISAETLTAAHLAAAGVPESTPIVGTDRGREFTRAILGNEMQLDVDAAREDLLAAARDLAADGTVGAIVLECTNMCPYAADIERETGLPTYSIHDLVCWLHAGLRPRRFDFG